MNISEAIRAAEPLGVPQAFGYAFTHWEDGGLHACGIGQALLGAGLITRDDALKWQGSIDRSRFYDLADEAWGRVACRKVFVMNDEQRLNLDQIADQLEKEGL